MAKKFENTKVLKDGRQFTLGDIWKVRDELIVLLPSDRIENKRKHHESRTVIITQNCSDNCDEDSYIIRIAPLASRVEFQGVFDVLLFPDLPGTKRDGVDRDCMVQLQLSQPILKVDLYEKVGEISVGKKEEIIATILGMAGVDLTK